MKANIYARASARSFRISLLILLVISEVCLHNYLLMVFSRATEASFDEGRKNATGFNITFEDDVELIGAKGEGTVSIGFKARIKGHNGSYVAKITGDDYLHWSDTEIEMLEILSAPPTIPNIPKLEFAIKSMPNPFHSRKHLERTLHLSHESTKWLLKRKNISVIVMEYLSQRRHRLPSSVPEIRTFLRSLLSTFSFAHSRNVMMCDLHPENIYFDGQTVKLFDWNAGFIYKPNSVKMHYDQEPEHLMPPEAWNNESAVHATVSGFDVWTTGLLLQEILEEVDAAEDPSYALLQDIMNVMLTKDPYQRPDANELLQHAFLKEKE